MSYDSDVSQNAREAASYVDHILSGTKVGRIAGALSDHISACRQS
jgi:hypothetical protein